MKAFNIVEKVVDEENQLLDTEELKKPQDTRLMIETQSLPQKN
jgi:hypothetical protein